jgi:hypothetical protein
VRKVPVCPSALVRFASTSWSCTALPAAEAQDAARASVCACVLQSVSRRDGHETRFLAPDASFLVCGDHTANSYYLRTSVDATLDRATMYSAARSTQERGSLRTVHVSVGSWGVQACEYVMAGIGISRRLILKRGPLGSLDDRTCLRFSNPHSAPQRVGEVKRMAWVFSDDKTEHLSPPNVNQTTRKFALSVLAIWLSVGLHPPRGAINHAAVKSASGSGAQGSDLVRSPGLDELPPHPWRLPLIEASQYTM